MGTQSVPVCQTSERRTKGRLQVAAAAVAGAVAITVALVTGSSTQASAATCGTPGGEAGWATVSGATTGGCGGPTVTVTSLSQLETEAAKTAPEVIRVNGLLTGSGQVKVGKNKTIVGVGANSGLRGIGLVIEHLHPANVIVQNMNIMQVPVTSGAGDAVRILDADHVWVDHSTLSDDLNHGPDYYDGLLNVTHAGDYVTVSWDHFALDIEDSLVGHSDSNGSEDIGHLRVTYHHNWFDRTPERNPRVRFGNPVHVYDNYYSNIEGSSAYYGIASTDNAGLLVQNNVFENVVQACWSKSGYDQSGPGYLVAEGNLLSNSGPCQTNGTAANIHSIPYAYHLDPASQVKSEVTAGAGAGHM